MRIYWYWPFVRSEELGVGNELLRCGHDVTLHTIRGRIAGATSHDPTPRTDGPQIHIDDSVPAVPQKSEGGARWLATRATTYPRRALNRHTTVKRGGFDVAHIVYLNYFTDGLSLARLGRRAPLVCTVHDVVPHQARVPSRVERTLLAAQYRSAGTIVVHHPSVGTRLTAEFDVDPQRIHFVPWAVPEVGAYPTQDADRPAQPDDGICTVLLFGTLRRNKGVEVLLAAMQLLNAPSIRLVVAGRGFADIEALVTDAAARDSRISACIGYVTEQEKAKLYRASDVVVLPYTTFSSQSAVLHDAYSHHLPVIASDVGALGDSVREDATGWVIHPSDPQQLASALEIAAASPAMRQAFGSASAQVAQDRSPAKVTQVLQQVYDRVRR